MQADLINEAQGLVLVFKVEEKPRIGAIAAVKGNSAKDEEDILAAMSTKSGSILNDNNPGAGFTENHRTYRKDGYYLAKVTHSVGFTADRGATLIINVDEGAFIHYS